jgi:acylphosphatase
MTSIMLRISGKVKNIGFRYFVKKSGESIGVFGYVKNIPEGVEIVGTGTDEQLKEFFELCKKGPPGSKVERIVKMNIAPKEKFVGFEIRY